MKRRDFVTGVLGLAVGAAGGWFANKSVGQGSDKRSELSAPSIATGTRELTMVTTWPKNFPGLGTGAERFASNLTAITDGRLTVKLFAAGELVPGLESFDAVSEGVADIMHAASYYWQGRDKGFNFFAAVPFGFTANEMASWINFGGGQELWDEISAPFNIKPFAAGNTGVQMGGWFRKEINSAEDIRGLKMRIPGIGGDVITRMGGTSVTLPGGEIFQALQSGTIDATEWVGPWNDLAFGFYKVARYYYYPGFHEPGTTLEASWNLETWNSLSKTDQELVKTLSSSEYNLMLAEFNANNSGALATLINDHNVLLRRFPDPVFKEFAQKTREALDQVASESESNAKIYRSMIDFRNKAIGWTFLSEESYAQNRRLALDSN